MIPKTNYTDVQTSGDLLETTASIEMTAEMFELMSSKIYTDKIMAVIREILCNAKDAQFECDEDRPIGIHLPNRFEPFLSIRDYGTGLSEDQVMKLYMRYGYSTKKKSNGAVGCMGIGSKSPLAYTDSFLVIAYFEGMKTTYNVFKDRGIPKVARMGSEATTDPTGVEIKMSVASHDFEVFASKAQKFLTHFGFPVDVTGNTVDLTIEKRLDEKLYTTFVSGNLLSKTVYAKMGPIVYQINQDLVTELKSLMARDEVLHMHFAIGEVRMAASREALEQDDETNDLIKARVVDILKDYHRVIQKHIDALKTPLEVVALLTKYSLITAGYGNRPTKVDTDKFTFKGKPIKDMLGGTAIKLRVIRSYGRHDSQDAQAALGTFTTIPVFLHADRKMGALKLAKKLSLDANNTPVIHLDDDFEINNCKEYFGADIKIISCKDRYPIEFPPGSVDKTVIKVGKSGLFTSHMVEVKTLQAEDKGFYIPFERDSNMMKGCPIGLSNFVSLLQRINECSSRKNKDNYYICRRGGVAAVKKTELVELTLPEFIKHYNDCFTAAEYDDFLCLQGVNNAILDGAQKEPLWSLLKQEAPLNYQKKVAHRASITGVQSFLARTTDGYHDIMIKDHKANVDNKRSLMTKEYKLVTAKYPLLALIPFHKVDKQVLSDLTDYIKSKQSTVLPKTITLGGGPVVANPQPAVSITAV